MKSRFFVQLSAKLIREYLKKQYLCTRKTTKTLKTMKTIYECSRSKAMNYLTIAGFIIIIASIVYILFMMIYQHMPIWEGVLVIIILVGALFAPFLTYPQYIIVTDEGIGIHTLARTRFIPYSNIETIERLDKSCIQGGTIRLFGIGGMLGNIGWFRNSQLGTFRAYITDSDKVFLIRLKQGKPIAISVSEPDDFMPFYLKGGNHVYSSK